MKTLTPSAKMVHAFLVLWARQNGQLPAAMVAQGYHIATKVAAGHSLNKNDLQVAKKVSQILFAHEASSSQNS